MPYIIVSCMAVVVAVIVYACLSTVKKLCPHCGGRLGCDPHRFRGVDYYECVICGKSFEMVKKT